MADFIGTIEVPEIIPTGLFPFVTDFPWSRVEERTIATHRFPMGDGRTEQRYLLGAVASIFSFRRQQLCQEDKDALVSFWETNQGALGLFTLLVTNEDGSISSKTVRFKDQTISIDGVFASIMSVGLEMIEVVVPADGSVTYPLNGTDTRFPGSILKTALLQPDQEIIPLIKIKVKDTTYNSNNPYIYLSDRRCVIGSQVYLPRLIRRGPIEIAINGESSPLELDFGNADKVMTQLAYSTPLKRAIVEVSFYQVASGIKLDFWKGYVIDYQVDNGPVFALQAAEGIYELTLSYPVRKQTILCYKIFDNVNSGCPYSTAGSGGDPTFCDKGFATPKGCQSHSMDRFFGGLNILPTTVATKDNSTGFHGIGRNTLAITSQVADSIFGKPLQEIYCDFSDDPDVTVGIPVNCDLAMGLDEGDFYDAVGIVCAGPIGEYAGVTNARSPFYLDGQTYFGWPKTTLGFRRSYGHDPVQDNDPDPGSQDFSIATSAGRTNDSKAAGVAFVEIARTDDKGLQLNTLASHSMQVAVRKGLGGYTWESGSRVFLSTGIANPVWVIVNMLLKALGLWGAPPDAIPLLADQEDVFDVATAHDLVANVINDVVPTIIGGSPDDGGLIASVEITAPGVGYKVNDIVVVPGGDGTAQLQVDSIDQSGGVLSLGIVLGSGRQYVNATGVNPTGGNGSGLTISVVATTVGDGTEVQYRFAGVIGQEQSLKDWFIQVLNSFLGIYSFAFGKLKIDAKYNSSVKSAFSIGNVILGSAKFPVKKNNFNRLLVNYADKEFQFVNNSVDCKDDTHAVLIGTPENPTYIPSEINLPSVFTKSQAARIGLTRLREELCGYTKEAFAYGHDVVFQTTLLAAEVEPGMVCSIEVDYAPNYPATAPDNTEDPQAAKDQYIEFRIQRMVLNEDYSMDIEGSPTHNDIYALVGGPKPVDVQSDPIPVQDKFPPANWKFQAYTLRDGYLRLRNFAVGTNSGAVHMGLFEIFYVDEATSFYAAHIQSISAVDTIIPFSGTPPKEGSYLLIHDEIMKVVKVSPIVGFENLYSAVTVERGQFDTVARAHNRVISHVLEIDSNFPNRIRIDTGLDLRPGFRLYDVEQSTYYDPDGSTLSHVDPTDVDFVTATGGYWSPSIAAGSVSEYDSATGWCVVTRPMRFGAETDTPSGIVVGEPIYFDARIWHISIKLHEISFPPRFFQSTKRATFEEVIPLQMAGVATIRGKLVSTHGHESNVLALFPIGADVLEPRPLPYHPPWPYFVRTLGNHRFVLTAPQVHPSDSTQEDIFSVLPVTQSQSFEYALATIDKGEGTPLPTPAAITSIVPTVTDPSGLLTLTGSVDVNLQIQIVVYAGNEIASKAWKAVDNGIDGTSTLADVAASLADYLNDPAKNEVFGHFYKAVASGNTITLQDNFGYGGNIEVFVIGDISVTAVGFLSVLGILQGRKYACAFVGAGTKSDISTLSRSTGPTGDLRRISIQDIPDSDDANVTLVEVYATPDGQDSPYYLLDTVPIHTRSFSDATPESLLSSKPEYSGVQQPATSGKAIITLKKNGVPWCDFYVPADKNVSNTVHGFALDPVSQDVELNADITSELTDPVDVFLEMQ